MNRNIESALAVTGVALAAIGAAMLSPRTAWAGGDITIDPTPFVSTATRADVRAEWRKGPPLLRGDFSIEPQRPTSDVTAAAVRAQYRDSRDLVSHMTGEDSGSAYLKGHPQSANPTAVMGAPAAPEAPAQVETLPTK